MSMVVKFVVQNLMFIAESHVQKSIILGEFIWISFLNIGLF